MGAAAWLIRRRLRRRWPAMVPTALVVAIGAGAALTALGAAARTDTAYERFLDTADVGDVVINPTLSSVDIDQAIRTLPGVRAVTRDVLYLANVGDEGRPRTRAEFDAEVITGMVRGSTDGRYTTMDRPAVGEGRFATGPGEAFITVDVAEDLDLSIGDVVPIAFWHSQDDLLAEPDDIVRPAGVERVTVVGIGTLPDEVLPESLYPRGQVILSDDVVGRYDCLPDVVPDASFEAAMQALAPRGCSTSYPYYSLEVDGGAAGADAALDSFIARATELNAHLPASLQEFGASYALIATSTADEEARVARSVRPAVTALVVLGLGAGVVTIALAGFAVARELRRTERDTLQWWQLGMTAGSRTLAVVAPQVAAAVIGIVVAVIAAWAASPLGPVGSVRRIEPSPGRQLPMPVVLAALALAVVIVAGIVALAVRSARRVGRAPARGRERSVVGQLVGGALGPEVADGLRAASGANRGIGIVAAGAAAAGALLTAVVFGASLSSLVSTPASYGWPWDAAVMGGYGYGGQDVEAVVSTMEERDDVERWTGLGFGAATVDGEPTVAMVGFGAPSELDVTVVDGRLPAADDEVVLGRRTADAIGAGVGDQVGLAADFVEPTPVTVSGIVVLPAIGPFQSDRAGPGTGLVVPPGMVDDERQDAYLSFVGMDLVDGADPVSILDELDDEIATWTLEPDTPAIPFAAPMRPPEIVNADSMQAVPLLIGGLLALAGAVGLTFAIVFSVRARGRELGILRALGFTGRQLRTSVRVQALATAVAALAVGAPLGVTVGRLAWRAFASDLGVATEPSTPASWLAATIAGGLAIAAVAAALAARAAARAEPAVVLRAE